MDSIKPYRSVNSRPLLRGSVGKVCKVFGILNKIGTFSEPFFQNLINVYIKLFHLILKLRVIERTEKACLKFAGKKIKPSLPLPFPFSIFLFHFPFFSYLFHSLFPSPFPLPLPSSSLSLPFSLLPFLYIFIHYSNTITYYDDIEQQTDGKKLKLLMISHLNEYDIFLFVYLNKLLPFSGFFEVSKNISLGTDIFLPRI